MSTARKLKAHDPNFTAARLEPGRKWIAIKNLEAPDELQPRAGIDKGWVSQLAAWFKEGSQFPPARVYQLPDARLMLSEGHHRRWALLDLGETDMLCEVVDGTMEQAIEHAAGSNKGTGPKPMGPKDVTRAVEMLLKIDKWWNSSALRISQTVGCSGPKVFSVRAAYSQKNGLQLPEFIETKSGRKTPIRVSTNRNVCVHKARYGFNTTYRGKAYWARSEEELRDKLQEIFKSEDKRRTSLGKGTIRSLISKYGFKSINYHRTQFPGCQGWHGCGVIIVTCAFKESTSLVETSGNITALLVAVGKQNANKQKEPISTRVVILCFKEDGPIDLIELFEESGIEFMTPDELIRSLGAGGMTPDEIQASLKETRD